MKPYLSEPYFFRGLAKLNLDDYEGAIQDYSKAIELNPNYFHAYMYRGVAWHNLRKYEEAMADYAQAIALEPRDAYVYANRGITEAETTNILSNRKHRPKTYSTGGLPKLKWGILRLLKKTTRKR